MYALGFNIHMLYFYRCTVILRMTLKIKYLDIKNYIEPHSGIFITHTTMQKLLSKNAYLVKNPQFSIDSAKFAFK